MLRAPLIWEFDELAERVMDETGCGFSVVAAAIFFMLNNGEIELLENGFDRDQGYVWRYSHG